MSQVSGIVYVIVFVIASVCVFVFVIVFFGQVMSSTLLYPVSLLSGC